MRDEGTQGHAEGSKKRLFITRFGTAPLPGNPEKHDLLMNISEEKPRELGNLRHKEEWKRWEAQWK